MYNASFYCIEVYEKIYTHDASAPLAMSILKVFNYGTIP